MNAALKPLGIRSNNPWNLQQEHIPYLGLEPDQAPSGELVFETLLEGIRAGVLLCYAYQRRGWNTAATFIAKYSPGAAGNPTAQYLANVCQWTGFAADALLDFRDLTTMTAWASAIFRQEDGANNAITDDQIRAGIDLASSD